MFSFKFNSYQIPYYPVKTNILVMLVSQLTMQHTSITIKIRSNVKTVLHPYLPNI